MSNGESNGKNMDHWCLLSYHLTFFLWFSLPLSFPLVLPTPEVSAFNGLGLDVIAIDRSTLNAGLWNRKLESSSSGSLPPRQVQMSDIGIPLAVGSLLWVTISTCLHPIQHYLLWSSSCPPPSIFPSMIVLSSESPLSVCPINSLIASEEHDLNVWKQCLFEMAQIYIVQRNCSKLLMKQYYPKRPTEYARQELCDVIKHRSNL